MTESPMILDLSVLPQQYRENLHIVLALRDAACVKYAAEIANSLYGKEINPDPIIEKSWIDTFDKAAKDWTDANPFQHHWPHHYNNWPEGATRYPGNDALEDAKKLLRAHMSGIIN